MKLKIIIDNNSIINFFRYYYFDKDYNNGKVIYNKLFDFLISKIEKKEIIIIDKVFNEYHRNNDFKKKIKKSVEDTSFLISFVADLSQKYYIKRNEKFFNYDRNLIEAALFKAEEEDADLFLVAYCKYLLEQNDRIEDPESKNDVFLITDETNNTKNYNKLIQKIPIICKSEGIKHNNIAYLLFNIYKEELSFYLDIKNQE